MDPHRTLFILKPDGYKRNLLAPVLNKLLPEHVRLIRIDTRYLRDDDVSHLYGRYENAPFYESLRNFMVSDPVIIMELAGHNAVHRVRKRVGEGKFPYPAGTIRACFGSRIRQRNVVHCSDSVPHAARELAYFFPKSITLSSFLVMNVVS